MGPTTTHPTIRNRTRLATVVLPAHSRWLGQRPAALDLGDATVRLVGLRRRGGAKPDAAEDAALEAGDTLVLRGRPEALARAEAFLLKG